MNPAGTARENQRKKRVIQVKTAKGGENQRREKNLPGAPWWLKKEKAPFKAKKKGRRGKEKIQKRYRFEDRNGQKEGQRKGRGLGLLKSPMYSSRSKKLDEQGSGQGAFV